MWWCGLVTSKPRVALIFGGDEQVRQSGRLNFLNKGSSDVYHLADLPDPDMFQMTKSYFRQRVRHAFDKYDLLVNLITDADENGTVLEILEKALQGSRVSVLNPPERVRGTTREGIAKQVAGIENLLVPRVRKIGSAKPQVLMGLERSGAMAYPAILRRAGTHSGRVLGVLSSPGVVVSGERNPRGYYLTEFVDFRSRDGLYRKYRVFMFGGTPVFRHMLISDRWNVHMSDRERFMMPRPELLEESQGLYERGVDNLPPHVRKVLEGVHERLRLDFFGIDFGVLPDGRVVLFEANATMNFFPVSDDPRLAAMNLCVPPAQAAFRQMISNALNG